MNYFDFLSFEAMVCAEDGLEPIRASVTELSPAMKKERTDRSQLVTGKLICDVHLVNITDLLVFIFSLNP